MNKYKYIITFSLLIMLGVGGSLFYQASKLGPVQNSTPSKLTPQTLKDFCRKDSNCFTSQLGLYMQKNGVDATVKLLNDTAKITDGLNNDCHNISHKIGGLAYKLIGVKAMKLHINSCQWGFGHGVMVEAALNLPIAEFSAAFKDFCTQDPEPIGCIHGVGHSLRTRNATSTQVQTICEVVSKAYDEPRASGYNGVSKTANGACVEGWVMQALGSYAWNALPNAKAATEFCKGFTEPALAICNGMAIRNYVDIASENKIRLARTSEFKDYCATVSNIQGYECGRYLGEAADDVAIPGSSFDYKYVASKLNLYCQGKWADACSTSFTNYQINRNDGVYKSMLETCKLLDSNLKKSCLASIAARTQKNISTLLKE